MTETVIDDATPLIDDAGTRRAQMREVWTGREVIDLPRMPQSEHCYACHVRFLGWGEGDFARSGARGPPVVDARLPWPAGSHKPDEWDPPIERYERMEAW